MKNLFCSLLHLFTPEEQIGQNCLHDGNLGFLAANLDILFKTQFNTMKYIYTKRDDGFPFDLFLSNAGIALFFKPLIASFNEICGHETFGN